MNPTTSSLLVMFMLSASFQTTAPTPRTTFARMHPIKPLPLPFLHSFHASCEPHVNA